VIYCGKNGVADPISLSGGALLIPAGYPCDISGKVYYLPDAAPPLALKAPPPTDNNGGAGYATSAIYFGRLRMDYNITDKISLSSVTGYLKQDAVEYDSFSYSGVGGPNTVIRGVNYNGVGLGVGGGLAYNNLRQFSEELRFVTSFDGPLNFMLAGFIEDRKIYFNTAQNAVNIALTFGPDPVTGATFDWYKTHYTRAKAYSVFGSGTYSITEQLKLTGGVRWTKEKKTQIIALPYEHAILTAIGFAPSGFVAAPIDFRDDNLSPEVSLTYTPTNDVTLYGAYKEGFKSGGIDNSALPSGSLKNLASPDPAVRAATAAGLKFASETVKGGEIGAKTQWLDRTLTLNASVYNYVFRNIQVQLLDAKAVQFRTTNAGELTSRGVDLDFQWRPSIEGLTIYGSAAYTDAKFTKSFVPDPIGQPGVDLRGRAAANAPKWAGNVAASYHAAVSDGYGLDLTGNVKYQSSYFIRNGNTQDYVQGASTLVDLAATIGPDTGPWSLSLIGTNITDKRIATSGGPRPFLTPTGDDQILNLNEGRKVYIQAALKF
jgi:iron complex outermembrane receptor protein